MTDTLFDDFADARLKQNIVSLTGSLAKIVALSAKSYQLATSPSETRYGFTAQEFVTQFPELTYYNTGVDNGTDPISATNYPWMIDYATLIPHLTVAVKELNTTVSNNTTSIASNTSSIASNNTAITALQGSSISQTSGNGSLGTLSWTATTAPSGTITKVYQWYKMGNICNIFWAVRASVAGLLVTQMSVPLPGDAPTPGNLSNQTNDSIVSLGSGAIQALVTAAVNQNACCLYKTSGGSYELRNFVTAGLAATYVTGQLTYFTT